MIIRKIYIRGFGKFSDFELDLFKNMNIIYGPNESGKSTVMAFIKAALYGLKGGRADKDGLVSEIKRYKPWNNGRYGGYINIETDNSGVYRLDRDFDNSSVKLFDRDFNEITGVYSGAKDGRGITEKLIGINENVFERTVFVKQLGTKIDTSASKDLIDRISNLGQSGYEDISYKQAGFVLKEALKVQVGTDRSYTRPLDIINRRLGELSGISDTIKEHENSLLQTRERHEQILSEIELLVNKENLIAMAVEFSQLKERLTVQKGKYEEIEFLNNGIKLSQKNIRKINEDQVALEQEAQQAVQQERGLRRELTGDRRADLDKESHKQKSLIKGLDIIGIMALMAVIAALWAVFLLDIMPIYFIVIPVLAAVISGTFRYISSKRLKELAEELKVLNEGEELAKHKLDNALKVKEMVDQQLSALSDRMGNEKIQLEQQIKRLEAVSLNFRQSEIQELERRIDQLSDNMIIQQEKIATMLSKAENLLLESVLENRDESHNRELSQMRQVYIEQLQQKKIEKAALELQLQKKGSTLETEAVEQEMHKLTQQKKALEQRGEALNIAIRTLEEASHEVQKKFLPVMNKVFNSTFAGLTAHRYNDTRAGDNLNIMLSDPASETVIPVSALSNGTMDQLYLALRIAIAETVLKGNEGLPLIMDEPFAQYDDDRTIKALNRIGELSKNRQIIIFTCKQREVEQINSCIGSGACKICSLT
ncbi:MAG: hypothetical protein K0R50_2623 [Eubacterium sp.]|jgi:DNA repair exonuclease SbcCD ATPase subunit|nr:hypothetical protein [Eubacterium sp.]